jgi:hypothetical protein
MRVLSSSEIKKIKNTQPDTAIKNKIQWRYLAFYNVAPKKPIFSIKQMDVL